MRILITGGVKSGKSKRAVDVALEQFEQPRYFLATAEAFDTEMQERINRHRVDRGDAFLTIEEPIHIDRQVHNNIILDCVTMWINNIMHYKKEDSWESILGRFLDQMGPNMIFVTNETGLGNIPADGFTRRYNRLLGAANIMIATRVDRVELMVSGYPVVVK